MSVCSSVHLSRIDILAKCQEFLGGYIGQTWDVPWEYPWVDIVYMYILCFSNKSYS